jgi:hypothetical protein
VLEQLAGFYAGQRVVLVVGWIERALEHPYARLHR